MWEHKQTPYEILGVSEDTPEREIKKIYHKQAKQYHPDLHPGDKEAEAKFKEINDAYTILSDSEKLAAYNEERQKASRGPVRRTASTGSAQDFGDMMNNLENMFGFGAQKKSPVPKGSGGVKLPNQPAGGNPLDGSTLFNKYFGKK